MARSESALPQLAGFTPFARGGPAVVLVFALQCLAVAQPQPAPVQPSVIRVGAWTLAGNWRVRGEGWSWFETNSGDHRYAFGSSLLRVSLARQTPRADWFVEGEQPLMLGLPSRAVAPAPQSQLGFGGTYAAANPGRDASAFVKQAYVRVKRLPGSAGNLRIGRFEFVDGTESTPESPTLVAIKRDRISNRLIGSFAFTNGRSLDGIHYVRNVPAANVTLVVARPTAGVFQVRGMSGLNVNLAYGAVTTPVGKKKNGEVRAFGVLYQDPRRVLKTDNRPEGIRRLDTGSIRIGTFGAHYAGVNRRARGLTDVLLWVVGQTGAWGHLRHRATAVVAEAGYQPEAMRARPWFRIGYSRGSGDRNRGDSTHGTFFPLLPTPRLHARFPFYNVMNNTDVHGSVLLRPGNKVTIRSELHRLSLTTSSDLWYSGGGAFQKQTFGFSGRPSNGSRPLAQVLDLSVDYVVGPKTSLTFYAAAARGSAVINAIFPAGRTAVYSYIELNRRF